MARKQGLLGIMPEPAGDIAAQIGAVADPRSAKQSAFIAKGSPMPAALPAGLRKVTKPAGTLVTSSAQHAKQFAKQPARVASLLGYPESKKQAMAGGKPVVVQGRTPHGAVVHESLASPRGLSMAKRAAAAAAPGGKVVLTTPPAVLVRRVLKR